MDWAEIVDNPYLNHLPFKIEQDRYGNILMSPASNRHNRVQIRLAKRLEKCLASGESFVEYSVQTTEGVKVPDVVWQSADHYAEHGDTTPMPLAPEVCVEVLSPSNSPREMDEKRALHFAAGALQVWVCREDGEMEFYNASGRMEQSAMAPTFPARIE